MCGNLVKYNKANATVSLAYYTVLSFLLGCSNILEVTSFAFEGNRAKQYLADSCLIYLSFTNFYRAIVRTLDTTHVHVLNKPIGLITGIVPNSVRPLAFPTFLSGRFGRVNKQIDLVNVLRSKLSAH